MNDPASAERVTGTIELLSRNGHLLQRLSWNGEPLRIGRAYDNDLVVTDPYVCPHHLELSVAADGQAMARDLGSVNGSYLGNSRDHFKSLGLVDGASLHFGHSQLRFHAGKSQVAPTLRDNARHGMASVLTRPLVMVGVVVLAILTLLASELLADPGKLGPLAYAEELTYPIIGIFAWAGFWALLNRVLAHRACFTTHLAIAMAGVISLFASVQLVSFVGFAFDLGNATWWLRWLARIGVLGGVVFAHLGYFSQSPVRRTALVASLVALVLFGTPAVGSFIERTQFSSLPWLDPLLRPPAFQLVDGESMEEFLLRAADLKASADEAAKD